MFNEQYQISEADRDTTLQNRLDKYLCNAQFCYIITNSIKVFSTSRNALLMTSKCKEISNAEIVYFIENCLYVICSVEILGTLNFKSYRITRIIRHYSVLSTQLKAFIHQAENSNHVIYFMFLNFSHAKLILSQQYQY